MKIGFSGAWVITMKIAATSAVIVIPSERSESRNLRYWTSVLRGSSPHLDSGLRRNDGGEAAPSFSSSYVAFAGPAAVPVS